jgi:predicted signal transduction protein with EAL and GGDEF domain
VQVSASIGVAGFPEHAGTPDRLERLADAALYLAKRQGRNRVELAEAAAVDAADGCLETSANGSDLAEPAAAKELK